MRYPVSVLLAVVLGLCLLLAPRPAAAGGLTPQAAEILENHCRTCCNEPCQPYCALLKGYLLSTDRYDAKGCLAYVTSRLAEHATLGCAQAMCAHMLRD